MLGDTSSVGFAPCALAGLLSALPKVGAIKLVRQKTPTEIILRAEDLRNLLNLGLFETAAAAGAYTPG